MRLLRRFSLDLLVLGVLLVVPLALLAPVTLGNRTLIPADNVFQWQPWQSYAEAYGVAVPHNELVSDLLLQNLAWKRFILQGLHNREIPLWNPYLFAGAPFAATGQHSMYYPFGLVFLLLPLPRAYGVFVVSQLFLAGAFMFLLARVLNMRRTAALAAAVVYQLCAYMLVSITFPMILAGSAWLPFLLAMMELVIRRRPAFSRPASLPWAALGATGLGMQLLVGHGENTYFTLLVVGLYAGWRLIGLPATRPHSQSLRQAVREAVQPAFWIAAMVAAGVGLGSVQLIPFVEVVRNNFREGAVSLADVLGWSYPYRRLITFLAPNFFGNPTHHTYLDLFSWQVRPVTSNALGAPINQIYWGMKNYVEGGAYVGVLTLLFAVIAVIRSFDRRSQIGRSSVWFAALLSLISLAFIFPTGAYAIIHAIPIINQSHSPFRWVFPLSLGMSLLAGWGLQAASDSSGRSVTLWLARLSTAAGALGLACLVLARALYSQIEPLIDRVFHSLARAPEGVPSTAAFFSYSSIQLAITALTLIAAGVVLHLATRRARRWQLLAVLILALDLAIATWGFVPAADPNLLASEPALIQFLKAQPGQWRLTTFDPHGEQPLHANTPWLYDLQDVRGYDSIISRQYVDYMEAIEPQLELLYNRVQPLREWSSINSPLLDLLNVKYIITAETLELPKLSLVWQGEGLHVYENLAVAPRAFSLPASATVISPEPLAAMAEHDPRYYVIVQPESAAATGIEPGQPTAAGAPIEATIAHYGSQEVKVQASVLERSWLVLGDSFFPGWKAYRRPLGCEQCDEVALEVMLVDGNLRGVLLDAGDWSVRFRYSPMSFKLGLFGSFMALMVVLFACAVWLWRAIYRESATDPAVRRLAKNSLAPMGINLLNRMIDLAFAALALRILGAENSGKYYVAINIAGWFEILANFGLHTLLTREVARDRASANRYLMNTTVLRLVTAVGAALPVSLYILVLARGSAPLASDTTLAIWLLVLGMIPGGVSTGLTGLFYAYEKAEIPAALTSISTILKVTLGTLVLLVGGGFVGLAGVSITVNLVTMVLLAALAFRLFFVPRLQLDWHLQWQMVGESWPLMLNHLLATLFFKVNVLLLERLGGTRLASGNTVVGWYSTAFKWVDALNLVPSLFTAAIFPLMSRQAKDSRQVMAETYQLAVKMLVIIALPLAVLTTAVAHFLIQILGGAEYLPHGANALQLLIWSIPIGWINSLTNYVLIALGQQRMLTRAFLLGVGFNVVANMLFLPRFGYPAAAIIAILSELVLLLAFYHYLRPALAAVPWLRLLWRPAAAAGAMAFSCWAGWQVHWSLGLVAGTAVYIGALLLLGTFGSSERALLAQLVPAQWRQSWPTRSPRASSR